MDTLSTLVSHLPETPSFVSINTGPRTLRLAASLFRMSTCLSKAQIALQIARLLPRNQSPDFIVPIQRRHWMPNFCHRASQQPKTWKKEEANWKSSDLATPFMFVIFCLNCQFRCANGPLFHAKRQFGFHKFIKIWNFCSQKSWWFETSDYAFYMALLAIISLPFYGWQGQMAKKLTRRRDNPRYMKPLPHSWAIEEALLCITNVN